MVAPPVTDIDEESNTDIPKPDEIEDEDTTDKEIENPAPSLPTDKEVLNTINPTTPLNAASLLPNTGEHTQTVWLTLGALSLLTGLRLVIKGKKKEE